VTVEEGAIGGFATQVLQFLAVTGQLDGGLKIRPLMLPDRFLDHDKPELQYEEAGLNATAIVATVLMALGRGVNQAPARA
jgi:1-deoxy-D-xylulose-5-phosphate synthase